MPGIEVEHRGGQHVRGVVADQVERVVVAVGDDRDLVAVGERPREVAHLAADLDRERRARQPGADRGRQVGAARAVREFLLRAVGKDHVHGAPDARRRGAASGGPRGRAHRADGGPRARLHAGQPRRAAGGRRLRLPALLRRQPEAVPGARRLRPRLARAGADRRPAPTCAPTSRATGSGATASSSTSRPTRASTGATTSSRFLIGCSFTFERALQAEGLPIRHVEQGVNVPMYRTSGRRARRPAASPARSSSRCAR